MNSSRSSQVWLMLMWLVGLLLVAARMEIPAVSLPVFLALDVIYIGVVLALLRRLDAGANRMATALAVSGPGLFAFVGFTGPPTADSPDLMMFNTAALLAIALWLLLVVTVLVTRYGAVVAGPGLVLMVVGTGVYVVNLLARVAVVLSGASGQQASVEDTAWVAYGYLRGLDGAPDFVTYLLVWLDLLQLGYVATVYVCFAGIARMLRMRGDVSDRVGRGIERVGYALAAVIVLGVTLAVVLPRDLDLVPAWAAFVASIPFMTTLLPSILGAAMLATARTPVSVGRTA
jgi:hypothetical protein